jgi:hypothetical protein
MAVAQRNEAPGDLELVRRFVNTRDVEEGTDELDGPESLLGWFSGMGLLDDEAIADEEDLKRSLALREGLRSLLSANNGEGVEPADLRKLNRVAESVCLRVRFDEDGRPTLWPESSGVSAALGRILAGNMGQVEGLYQRCLPMGLLRPLQEPLRQVVHDGGLRQPHEGTHLSAASGHPRRVRPYHRP